MSCPVPACVNCPKPGSCCSRFALNAASLSSAMTELEALVVLASIRTQDCEKRWIVGLPLMPDGWRAPNGEWSAEKEVEGSDRAYTCLDLRPDGRCGNYEHRPRFCSDFQAGSDRLCCMTPAIVPLPLTPRGVSRKAAEEVGVDPIVNVEEMPA